MKSCVVKVSIDESQKTALGNRWKDGKTTVFLKPVFAHFGGKWDSDRQIDIDSAAGTNHALYVWKQPLFSGDSTICLGTSGYQGDTDDSTVLQFDKFERWKVKESGEGIFYFRREEWNIYWEIVRLD